MCGDGDLDIQANDIQKCFDEMIYSETHNDLWEVCPKDDKFKVIAKLDEKCAVKVKTPCGLTESFFLKEIVPQGSVSASLERSIQVDTTGSECEQTDNGMGLYKYKKSVLIPPLSMVDDVLSITKCGLATIEANSILNAKIESKKLRMSKDKCSKMHISKKQTECSVKVKVHETVMKETNSITYLGDVLLPTGKIDDTIKGRTLKGIGINSQINSILNNVTLGMFFIQTALILREAMLVNGTLTNCEIWPPISEKHMKSLEDMDIKLFLSIHSNIIHTPAK